VPSHSPGRLRHAANAVVRHFTERGAPDDNGLLSIGWHGPQPEIAQAYSGPGSPYWASKGLLGIALPAGHPVWTAPAEPLPIEAGDVLRAVRAPGWIVSGRRADGVVRVVNHGTDHAAEGDVLADAPLYARLGYATSTQAADQPVVLVDDRGRSSHRTGLRTLAVRVENGVGVAGSTTLAHWVDPGPGRPDHGRGAQGHAEPAGRLTVWSLVRGPWELRLIRVDEPAANAGRLRIGAHLDLPVTPGAWVTVLLTASREPVPWPADIDPQEVRAAWPDGLHTRTSLMKEKG